MLVCQSRDNHGKVKEIVAFVTSDGVENLSAFVPSKLDDIERFMKEKGLIEFRPATPSFKKK